MNVGVNYLREHIIQQARIHYVIEAGGVSLTSFPIMHVAGTMYVPPRWTSSNTFYNRVIKIAEGAALMTETTLSVEMDRGSYNRYLRRP